MGIPFFFDSKGERSRQSQANTSPLGSYGPEDVWHGDLSLLPPFNNGKNIPKMGVDHDSGNQQSVQ